MRFNTWLLQQQSMAVENPILSIGVIGTPGCGKTTLLKLASGIEKLQIGEIKLNDRLVSSVNFHLNSDKRDIGYVFQESF